MSRVSLILVFTMHGAGVLCLLSGFWTCLWAVIVMGLGVQVWNAPDYRPAVFVVESTSYYSGDVQSPDVTPTAEGKVEGQAESLSLGDLLERAPRDEADLTALVPPGRQFKVLYNPRVPRGAFQDRYIRVLPYAEDFARRSRERLVRFTLLGYGPLLVFLPLTLILALLLRRVGADNPGPGGKPFPTGAAMAWLYVGMPLLMLGIQTLAAALWVAR